MYVCVCVLLTGAAICLSADCYAVFYLRHHWHAGMKIIFSIFLSLSLQILLTNLYALNTYNCTPFPPLLPDRIADYFPFVIYVDIVL